jgi:hypothetical protein
MGVRHRSAFPALLSEGGDADSRYRKAIDRLGRTRVRVELARSHLLYGEWLRRERRRGEAREQLRAAYQMLEAMGIEAFAERAAASCWPPPSAPSGQPHATGPGHRTPDRSGGPGGPVGPGRFANSEIGARSFSSAYSPVSPG